MGRMSDLIRTAPIRTPRLRLPTPIAEPVESIEPADVAIAAYDPLPDADDSIPFIEVGGEPAGLRVFAQPIAPPILRPRNEPITPFTSASVAPGLFTIRFHPIEESQDIDFGYGPELIALHEPDHAISGQYRMLLADIVNQLPNDGPRVLLFSASGSETGTSTVLLNLAFTIARQPSTQVAVIDAHRDRPAIAARLGLPSGPGLREVLANQTPLSWAMQPTRLPNVRVLTSGRYSAPPLNSPINPVVNELRNECEWILIDSAAVLDPADLAPLAAVSDALYLVMRQSEAGSTESVALQRSLCDQTGKLRGCVMTQS